MYYSLSDTGQTYICSGNNFPHLVEEIPEGSDVPPPPNPLLEDIASGNVQGNDDYQHNVFSGMDRNLLSEGYHNKRVVNDYRSLRPQYRNNYRGYGTYGGGNRFYGPRQRYDPNTYQYDYEDYEENPYPQDQFYQDVTNQRSRYRGNNDEDDEGIDTQEDGGDRFYGNRYESNRRKTISHGPLSNQQPQYTDFQNYDKNPSAVNSGKQQTTSQSQQILPQKDIASSMHAENTDRKTSPSVNRTLINSKVSQVYWYSLPLHLQIHIILLLWCYYVVVHARMKGINVMGVCVV